VKGSVGSGIAGEVYTGGRAEQQAKSLMDASHQEIREFA
jgi:hypothetical protein